MIAPCPQRVQKAEAEAASRPLRETVLHAALGAGLLVAFAAPLGGGANAMKLNVEHVEQTRGDQSAHDPSFVNALSRACPDILDNPGQYDDALIALCLKAWRRP